MLAPRTATKLSVDRAKLSFLLITGRQISTLTVLAEEEEQSQDMYTVLKVWFKVDFSVGALV